MLPEDEKAFLADVRESIHGLKNVMTAILILGVAHLAVEIIAGVQGVQDPPPPAPVTVTTGDDSASVVIHNPDPLEAIREKGERRGYFTSDDLTTMEGLSDRTFDRLIADDRIEPAPVKNGSGHWQIPLDYRVEPARQ